MYEGLRLSNARQRCETGARAPGRSSARAPAASALSERALAPVLLDRDQAQRAGSAARKSERDRIQMVFGCSASRGREWMAADMLANGQEDGPTIVARLGAMPTDAELERRRGADAQARAGSLWDRVIEGTFK